MNEISIYVYLIYMAVSAILVDDVKGARENLLADVQRYCPHVSVIGEAATVVEAAKIIRQLKPELVFLDIQLPDGTGFDVLEMFDQVPFRVIFTTASNEHAIKAFKYAAVDYLLKPIDPQELKSAVERAMNVKGRDASIDLLRENAKQTDRSQKKLALHSLDKIIVVSVTDIMRCESDVNYTRFFINDGQKIMVTRTLKEFEELLSEHGFARIHQSHLVNADYIREFIKADGGHLILKDGSEIPVSTRKRAYVMELLNSL
ncbi:MAG: LytR/AlgR family response regulator transcription factor [Flavobacteriales bacterium]